MVGAIILALIGVIGAILGFLQFLITRKDKKLEDRLDERFNKLDTKIDNMKEEFDEKFNALNRKIDDNEATNARIRILQFSEQLQHGDGKSKESYDQIHEDIDRYNNHCKKYDDYPNSRAGDAIENIETLYKEKLKLQSDGKEGFIN